MSQKPILLVEDDPDIQENLKLFFEMENILVHVVSNGQEALGYLKSGEPVRMILLDLMMPIMNGYEFLDRMASAEYSEFARIPIVILSASPDLQRVAQARRVGFVKKPIDLDILLEAISTA